MFNHHHYWPERRAYERQEEMLKEGRIQRLVRQSRLHEPSPVTRLAKAMGSLTIRIVTRLRRVRTQLLGKRALVTSQRSSTWPLE